MDIHFVDPEDAPQTPDRIRFRDVSINVYPDKRRLKLRVEVTLFQEPPNMEIDVSNPYGESVASASVIGMNGPTLELTLHLRGEVPLGEYALNLQMGYHDKEPVDFREVRFVISNTENHESE